MDKKVTLIFEHKKDKDQLTETYSIHELIYGVGESEQPIKEIIEGYKEDGYKLIDAIV